MALNLLEGNEAIALGAMKSGCNFFAGYPITPATSIFNTMLKLLPPHGGTCIQGEDEIASIGYCLGASMAGNKVMTATSGPGLSLYSEQISFAIGSEIPIVIVNVQRLGPSTGSATKGADGDICFMRWCNSGGLPIIVLAPVDIRDCYALTVHAFNLAEKYRCPVFIAANKEISLTKESVDLSSVPLPEIFNRKTYESDAPFLPFDTPNGKTVPDFLPIGGKTIVRQTSSTHGRNGYITTDPDEIAEFEQRLKTKIENDIGSFTIYEEFSEEDSDTLIISYGVTSRAAKKVYNDLMDQGKPVSLLILKTIWPVPEKLIKRAAENKKRIIVPEMNLGQYVKEIERVLCDKKVEFTGFMNGKLISPAQIMEVINNG